MISKLVCYCNFDTFVLTFKVQFSWDLLANLVDIEDFLASRISVHDINHPQGKFLNLQVHFKSLQMSFRH